MHYDVIRGCSEEVVMPACNELPEKSLRQFRNNEESQTRAINGRQGKS